MLGESFCENTDEIIEIWYSKWKDTKHPHPEISEALLKDHLPVQLKVIGEELVKVGKSEDPSELWQISKRLDPEARVTQDVPIEEVIHEYRLLVSTVREWIESNEIDVSSSEFSYFSEAVFELIAETIRRYTKFKEERVRDERKAYLAGLVHQMRNPLIVISNQLELIKNGYEKLEGEEIERLSRNANRLLHLTKGVLRLERFESRELPVYPKEVHPADILNHILDDYRHEAKRKGLELRVNVDRNLKVEVDPELFVDVMGNLIDNSIKYTEKGHVEVKAAGNGNEILFSVKDTGSGISEERQKEMFRPIQPQASGGAGIGLAIVRRSVEAMGGSVSLESELGNGAKFRVRIPKVVKAQNQAELD